MESKKLIYASDARKAILKADPKLAYCIDGITGVDAVEVVHGRWKTYSDIAVCNLCNSHVVAEQGTAELNYCPNCGAKMDGDGNG